MFDVHALNFIKSSLRLPNFLEGKTDGNIWILFACFFQLCMCVCFFFFGKILQMKAPSENTVKKVLQVLG